MALVLPMAFHLTEYRNRSSILPMHIPVLLGGFVLGPVFGFCRIVFTDYKLCFDGYAGSGRLPFMMIELAVYGLVSGLMYNTFKFNKKKNGDIYFTFNCNALR